MSVMGGSPLGRGPLGGFGGLAGSQILGLTLRIGAVDATPYLQVDSWRLTEELNSRDEAEFTLLTTDQWIPGEGQEVRLTLNGERLFGGTVQEVDAGFLDDGSDAWTRIDVQCVDYNQLADRFVVGEVYEGRTAGAILRALVTKYLVYEGIDPSGIQDGPTLSKVIFPNVPLAQACDGISELTGYHWNIDDYKTFHFAPFEPSQTQIVIDTSHADFRNLRRKTTRNQFRNVQFIDGAYFLTDIFREEFVLDGKERTKNTGFEVHSLRHLWVNNIEQAIGIRGVDQEKGWYWSQGDTAVSQETDDAAWPEGSVLRVEYQGRYKSPSVVEAPDAIDARRAIEGGSGRYEHVIRDSSLVGDALIAEKGMGLLRRFKTIDKELSFETERVGFAVGQAIEMDVPRLGVHHEKFLVTGLETTSIVVMRRFHVQVTSGELKGTGNEFFKRLFSSGQALSLNESEILNKIAAISDSVSMTDTLTAASGAYASAVCGTAVIGECEL